MKTINVILTGCVALLGINLLKRKKASNLNSGNPFVISAIMDYYFTPYQPGIVQNGKLTFSKKSIDDALVLSDINMSLSNSQITQRGQNITIDELNDAVYARFIHSDTPAKSYTLPVRSETLDIPIQIQVTQYKPDAKHFCFTSDFKQYPLSVLVDVSYKVDGVPFMETIVVPFTDYKKS